MTERPLGVTIIGILWILSGLLALFGGIGIAALGSLVAGPIGGIIGLGLGVALLVIGIIEIVLGIGCFKRWGWVWTVGVIVTIISLLMGIVDLFRTGAGALLGIVISVVILWYLFRENVKKYFGKA